MVENIINQISPSDVNSINTLSLAYIGDSVWEMYVRNFVMFKNKHSKVNKLHHISTSLVKAKSQAQMVKDLKDHNVIDEKMWDVVMRGRNSASNPPKNADVQDYNYATGFEALIGYLYIIQDFAKLDEIAGFCLYDK